MKTYKIIKVFVSLLIVVSTVLGLTGCVAGGKMIGWSDYYYADSEKYSAGGAELTEAVGDIDIDWMAGNVTVKPHDSDAVCFSEQSRGEATEDTKLRYWLDGTTLRIKFCACGKRNFFEIRKDLTVLVPETSIFGNLKVSSISANIKLSDCTVRESVKIDTVSGETEASFLRPLDKFEGNSTSGEFTVTAPSISCFDVDSVSGAVSLSVKKEPDKLSVDTTSGGVSLTLPENASFTLDYVTTSGDLSSDLPCRMFAGKYVFGDGKGKYDIDTVSGDVRITANA